MKKFLETIINIYNINELRQRIGMTLFLLLVYRLGAQIVIPGTKPPLLFKSSDILLVGTVIAV